MAKKYNPWAYTKKPEIDPTKRRLTLFVAGAVPEHLPDRIDRLTSKYDDVTVMCAGYTDRIGTQIEEKTVMAKILQDWAHTRGEKCDVIPWRNIGKLAGWAQFMSEDTNKAVIMYDDGKERDDIKFAETLTAEENVQGRKIKIEKEADISTDNDFAAAVRSISADTDKGFTR